jgi:glycosyltransferase involved in cell wall biosynthesis
MAKLTHILFLPRWYPNPEDPQLGVFIQKHAKAAALNHRVTVIYPFGVENQLERYVLDIQTATNITEVKVWYRKSENTLVNVIRYYTAFFKAKKQVALSWKSIDVSHVNIMAKSAVMALGLKLFFGIPYIITEQWSGYTTTAGLFVTKPKWQQHVWRLLTTQASLIITVSRFLQLAMKQLNLGQHFAWMPNVVENVSLVPPSTNNNALRLLNVSDLVDSTKNISGLLSAMKTVVKYYPTIKLNIIGGGKDEAMLKQLCMDYELEKHVVFHGRVTNDVVYQYMHETDAVIINSFFETFSVVAAEGLICGKPVIATDCGGPSEFINEEVGTLVTIDDAEQLAKGIMHVLENLSRYEAQKLHDYAKNKFSYEAVAKQLQGFYKAVLS